MPAAKASPDPGVAMRRDAYRDALGANAARAMVPYGYTAMNVAAGGVLVGRHGAPTAFEAFLFLFGALAGFALVGLLAGAAGDFTEQAAAPPLLWAGLSSGLGGFAGFGVALLVGEAGAGSVAFGAVALGSTFAYFTVGAVGPVLHAELRRRRAPRAPGA